MTLKILHVFNIAQNAYINARLLQQAGHDCDVLTCDLYHFACSPEWYELFGVDAPPAVTEDGFFPDFYSLNKDMPVIAENVAQGPMFNALVYLHLKRAGDPLAATAFCALRYLRFKCTILKTTTPFMVSWSEQEFQAALDRYQLPEELHEAIVAGRMVDNVLEFIRTRLTRFASGADVKTISIPFVQSASSQLDSVMKYDAGLRDFVSEMRSKGLMFALGLERQPSEGTDLSILSDVGPEAELRAFQVHGDLWRALHARYDMVIFYAHSSIFAITNGITGYCALEIGTIRVIPFENSTYGRLVAAGYRMADKVFVTNADYITNTKRLEFRADQVVYLPHPFDEKAAFSMQAGFKPPEREHGRVRFFCPARQDWQSRDPKMAKGNDYIFHAARGLLGAGVRNFQITCIAWGVDLQATRDLCDELGLTDHVTWISPLTTRRLWEAMLSHDCVIDQFLISAMGAIAFESLALGRRLISRDDGVENTTFYGERPPILSAATISDIQARMHQVINDPDDSAGIGQRGMDWIATYHSAERNIKLQMVAFADIASKRGGAAR